jgi:hypothetical protein
MTVKINPDPTLQNNLMSFGFECTIPESLILGENNCSISEIKANDVVIGNSGSTSVLKTFEREYKGFVFEIRGEGMLPFIVTPDHPILVTQNNWERTKNGIGETKEWLKSSELLEKHHHNNGHSLIIPRNKPSMDILELDLLKFRKGLKGVMSATKILLNKDVAWLFGLYAAEGSPGNNGIQFSLHSSESELIDSIDRISRKFLNHPTSKKVHLSNHCAVVTIPSKILARAFPTWCGKGASNKKIPDFIFYNKNENILNAFIEGYFAGDGCKTISKGTKYWSATTVSKTLALQLQLAFAKTGVFAHLFLSKEKGKSLILGRLCNTKEKYSILVNLSQKRSFVKITDDSILVPIRKIKKTYYSGKVYNIKTQDGTYLLSNTVVHNCDQGWYPLIQELIDRLNELPEEIEVLQVKEKFAGLRFYVSGASEKANNIISLYETYSYHICEHCGEFWTAKERVNHGWWKTLDDKCAKELGYE